MRHNGWLYEMCGFKNGIPSRYMNVNVGDELTIMANDLAKKRSHLITLQIDTKLYWLCFLAVVVCR